MNSGLHLVPLNSICEGCLCVDRQLQPILDDESAKVFRESLGSLKHINYPLALCWECNSVISRVLKFRKQVKSAHEHLVKYMLHKASNLPSLTQLKAITIKETVNYQYRDSFKVDKDSSTIGISEDSEHWQHTATKIEGADDTAIEVDDVKHTTEDRWQQAAKCDGNQMMFIKTEDFDFHDNGDSTSVGECRNNDVDKDTKTELKSDQFQCKLPSEKKSKSKKTRKKTKVEFNESDDEPLKIKKQKDEENGESKKRGRKKKTEEDCKPPVKRCRREQAAGVVSSPRVDNKLAQLNVASGQLEKCVLSWEEVSVEREKALSSVVFTRHEYRCYDCVLGFNHRFKLENHMKKHDPSMGEMECSVCKVRFRDQHALCAHRRRHRVKWRCCTCGDLSSRAAIAADHHARAHGAPPPTHVCSTCGHKENSLGKLRIHLKNHAERQKCDLCEKTFRDRTSLRTHLFIHRGEKEYACPRCAKRFLFKKAMEVHMITHDAPEQLYCYQCDMNFKNKMSYYQHMKYNLKHVDPAKLKYACSLCDKKFVKASRLEEHNVAVHLKATPVKCTTPGCTFACSSRPVLRTHIRMVHRNLRAVRNHVCDTCGKAYTTKKILEGHMRSHTGERPFSCALCPSTFGYEAALYNHNKLVHVKAKANRRNQGVPAIPTMSAVPTPAVGPGGWQLALNITQVQQNDVS